MTNGGQANGRQANGRQAAAEAPHDARPSRHRPRRPRSAPAIGGSASGNVRTRHRRDPDGFSRLIAGRNAGRYISRIVARCVARCVADIAVRRISFEVEPQGDVETACQSYRPNHRQTGAKGRRQARSETNFETGREVFNRAVSRAVSLAVSRDKIRTDSHLRGEVACPIGRQGGHEARLVNSLRANSHLTNSNLAIRFAYAISIAQNCFQPGR